MHVKSLQKSLLESCDPPITGLEALRQLKAATDKALGYFEEGNTPFAQNYLERSLTFMMLAFHYLNLDIEKVVAREAFRQKADNTLHERVILVFGDHAELRVSGELRGTFPLYTEEDYAEVRQIAQLFECRLEHADHVQLDLFGLLKAGKGDSAAPQSE